MNEFDEPHYIPAQGQPERMRRCFSMVQAQAQGRQDFFFFVTTIKKCLGESNQ